MSKNANYIYPILVMSNDIIFRGVGGIAVNLRVYIFLYLFDSKQHDYFFARSFGERG